MSLRVEGRRCSNILNIRCIDEISKNGHLVKQSQTLVGLFTLKIFVPYKESKLGFHLTIYHFRELIVVYEGCGYV